LRNFLRGAAGYLGGLVSGIVFLLITTQLGLISLLTGIVDDSQPLVHLLARLIFAGLIVALGGAIVGAIGGSVLASILGIKRKRRLVIGSAIAYGIAVGILTLVFLLLISFLGLYNNLTDNRIEEYGIIFGLFGLVFGLIVGIFRAFLCLRLRDTWRIILAAVIGFAAGGVIMGLLVRLVNPTAGFQTYPLLTWVVLLIALATPFMAGGGTLGFTFGRLARRASRKGEKVEELQPSAWQTGIVAGVVILLALAILTIIGNLKGFITINPAPIKAQIPSETFGVWWTDRRAVDDTSDYTFPTEPQGRVTITGADDVVHQAWCNPDGCSNINGEVIKLSKSTARPVPEYLPWLWIIAATLILSGSLLRLLIPMG
jgi:hypothetical protein